MKSRITEIKAISGAVDRLYLNMKVEAPGWGGEEYVVVGVQADLLFSAGALGTGFQAPPENDCRLSLAARTVDLDKSGRIRRWGQWPLSFVVDVTPLALNRIEEMRSGGTIHLQIAGVVTVLMAGNDSSGQPGLDSQFSSPGRGVHTRLQCEDFMVPRDTWAQVLDRLRPDRHHLLEVVVPEAERVGAKAQAALDHLQAAQTALDDGRWPAVLAEVYKASEYMAACSDAIGDRYGEELAAAVMRHRKSLGGLCNPARHGKEPGQEQKIERRLAQAALVSAQGLAAVILRP